MVSWPEEVNVNGTRYALGACIGRGGQGTIFVAFALDATRRRVTPEQKVALKFVPVGNGVEAAREEKALRKLCGRTPRVPRFVGSGEAGGMRCLAFEYVEGTSLAAWMEANGKRVRESREGILQALQIVEQLLEVLAVVHKPAEGDEGGIVHRDIKPENIMIVRTNPIEIKVIDFGIAVDHDATTSLEEEKKGSCLYAGPLHFESKRPDARADLWSTGVVLYWLLTGRHPFHDRPENEVSHELHQLRIRQPYRRLSVQSLAVGEQALVQLGSLFDRCFAHDRNHWYRDADSMKAAISGIMRLLTSPKTASPLMANGMACGSRPSKRPQPLHHPSPPSMLHLALGSGLLLAAAVLLIASSQVEQTSGPVGPTSNPAPLLFFLGLSVGVVGLWLTLLALQR